MGVITATSDHSGQVIRGISLGVPARIEDGEGNLSGPYRWCDSRLPDGEIDDDGVLTIFNTEV